MASWPLEDIRLKPRLGTSSRRRHQMTLPTQRLRDEHAGLLPNIESLKQLAHDVVTAPADELRDGLEEAYLFLEHKLIPHARAEDRILYPAIAKVLGSGRAMEGMTREHVEVGTLSNELGILRVELVDDEEPATELKHEIQRVLYGLYTLLKYHIAKEEELYLPLLDGNLSEEETTKLFEEMERVSRDSRFQIV
jgi:iron-sulfur cluster repair protein YtfE (RIC family)